MFNKRFTLIIAFMATAVLMTGCSTENSEYGGEPQNAAAQGGAADDSGDVHSTVFSDGTPASEDDLKPETAVFVQSDYTLTIYPEQMHCTKIIILK